MAVSQPVVLFLCVHNAGRSQMAAALLEREAKGTITILSAGSAPGEQLNPVVLEVLQEIGISISANKPKKLTEQMGLDADVIVTMGCGDACPYYPDKRYLDWELTDPAGASLEIVRGIRDEIHARVKELARELLAT